MSISEIEDSDSYTHCRQAAFPLSTHALHASAAAPLSILDSGATKHFTGYKSDFTTFTTWAQPRPIHIADGKEAYAIGCGTISLKSATSPSGNFILANV
jgi:hypothetical protein